MKKNKKYFVEWYRGESFEKVSIAFEAIGVAAELAKAVLKDGNTEVRIIAREVDE